MPIDRDNYMVNEAVLALLLVWDAQTVRLVLNALHEEIQEGDHLTPAERAKLERASELLNLMEIRRWDEQRTWDKQGLKAYWEQGVPSTDNGPARPALRVIAPDEP